MKKIDSVNNSKVVLGLLSGLKSRITSIKPLLTMLALLMVALFGVNEAAWAWRGARVYVKSEPSTGGTVDVSTGNSNGYSTSESAEDWNLRTGTQSFSFKLYYNAKTSDGYQFKGWALNNKNVNTGTTGNPLSVSCNGTNGFSYNEYTYYAIFARMAAKSPAAGSTLTFANTTVTESSAWQTITINHAHAGTVTIEQTGDDGDFFIGATEDATSEIESFTSTSETTKTLHIQFRPTSNNLRTCTLTVSSDNGLSSLTYYLSGIGYAKPSVTWVNEDGTEVTSGELTLGKGEIIKATCTTEQTITYSDYNTTYFEEVTHDGSPALRVKSNFTGTFSNLNVRANLAANNSSYIAAYHEDFKLNVTSLTPQRIVWEDDITDLDNSKAFPYYIPLNAVAYDTETNEPSGMGITYSVSSTSYVEISNGQLKVKAIGGPTTITATAASSANYAPIAVSKQITVSDVKTACATKDTDSGGSFNKNGSHTVYVSTPGKMTFYARRESILLRKDLTVTEYNNNGGVLHTTTISCDDIGTSGSGSKKEITLQPTTASVKFSTSANYTYYITSIEVARITSVTKDKSEISYEAYKGMESSAQLSITYSNVPVYLSFKHGASSRWSLDKSKIGGCGKRGSAAVTLTFSAAETGTYTDTLYIKSNTGKDYGFVKLTAEVTALAQFLDTWNIEDTYNTTDQTTLSAKTTENKTNFTFSVQSSTPANIVNIDANGQMTFNGSGTAVIKAVCPAYGIYDEFSDTHDITVNKVTPDIATEPTVAEIKYKGSFANSQLSGGKATVTLRGTAGTEVAGSFKWATLNGTTVDDAQGSHDYSITFTPTDGGMYNPTTFTQSVTISRADGSIEMNNGSVNVKVAGINDDLNECKIDLDDLVKTKVVDAVANRAGDVTYEVISANKANAAIDGDNKFSAAQAGSYTIRATQAQTDYYEEATDEFTVTVNKLVPTIVFDNTENPQIIYSGDVIEKPAYRQYNGKEIDRNVQYVSSDMSNTGAIYVNGTTLTARNVTAQEGSSVNVTITASTTADALYNAASVSATHNYAVRAKRSPVFTMEGVDNAPVSKTLNIGEQAIITYNENTNEFLTVGTASEHAYVSFVHEPANRRVIVTAVKGTVIGDGVQEITVNQPGNDYLFPRNITYTFTVKKNVSTLSLAGLTTAMEVEDTVATPYTGLANTDAAVQFSCSPEGGMKMENGKLIALQAGTNTVTFSQPATEYWTGISQSKTITVSKKNPNMTTALSNRHPWYAIIEHPFSSLNTEKALSITSSNESLAKYIKEEDKIYVYGTSGNVTFTVNQEANYKYNAVENYQKTFKIFQPNNRLPFTLNNSNFEDYKGGYAGNVSWNDGVLCGRPNTSVLLPTTGDYFDWSAKYIILKFVGVPDKLSFDFENASSIATQYGWHFYQSSNGKDWNLIKEYQDLLLDASGGTSSGSESNLQLDPATQYIKLEYHGNYGGRFKNVHVTERKEIAPRDATKDFGLGHNGNDPTMRAITVDWYNVKPCTVTITGTDADKFVLDEGSKTINSQLDHYGTVDLMVSYKHETNSETTHTATLHIEDEDGNYADVTLNGQTTPAPQTIIWRNDLTPMPIEGSFQNAAMVSTGQTVTLVSDHPEVVRVVDNTTLEPVSAGTARVTATAAGNTKWAETTDYMDIEVTTLKVQYITWTDNLSNRKCEDGQTVNITLTATSSAGLPITYELDEDAQAFASISGNVLRLTGWGSGQVIAKQVGNEEYVAVQTSKSLVSRNPNAKCRPLVGEYKDAYTLHTLAVKDIPIYGEPDSVTFWAKCDWDALWGMWVAEEYNGAFHDIQEISRTGKPNITSDYQYYSFPLHRNATAVRLYTKTGATMTRTFKNVEIPLAKYLELAENTMNFSQVDKGSTKTQSFYINYSNLSGVLDVEMKNKENTQFTVVTTMVGEDCGDIGQNVRIEISCTGTTLGTENNKIIISNKDQRLEIPLSATVVLPSQAITWEPELNVLTTDHVVLSATATSELPVSFTSGNTEIAEVVYEAGVYSLDIKSYGDVAITAHQPGDNENWSAATDKTLTFHISRVVPEVTAWPTAQVILPNTVGGATLIGGIAPEGIAGSFNWEDESLEVTRQAHTFNVVFVPNNTNYYEPVSHPLEIEILKTPQTITWNRANESEEGCSNVVILDATASSNLPITYHSSDSAKAYAIKDEVNNVMKLYILKGGDVTITAEQLGDDTYAAAESVSKTITLIRVIPTIETLPTATDMFVHHFLSNSTPQGGLVKAGENTVTGVFNWGDGMEVMDVPGTNQRTVVFHPYNSDFYQEVSTTIDVEVLRFAPTVLHNFTTETKVYGTKLSEFTLSGEGHGYDYTDPAHLEIEGTFSWKNENYMPSVSDAYATMIFHPTHTEWYDDVEVEVPISITKAAIVSATATANIFYGQVLSEAVLVNTTTGIVNGITGVVAGIVTWDSSLDPMEYYTEGTHPGLPIRFTPTDPNYESVEIAGIAVLTVEAGYVFDGNEGTSKTWGDNANWMDNAAPENNGEKVVILADVDIEGNVSVASMTIKDDVTVTVKDGATLTLGAYDSYVRSTYGNLKVENGGQVIFNDGILKVNDFTLQSKLGDAENTGKSGQVFNPASLDVRGNAYFELALDPTNECTYGWYDFTVPFPVDALNGVTRYNNGTPHVEQTITNEVHYAIMDFSESRRVETGYGWKKFRGIMQPGQCYTITTNNEDNVYRFKKTADGAFNTQLKTSLAYSSDVESDVRGWNCLGNGTMAYADLSAAGIEKVQLYSHGTNSYIPVKIDEYTYVVGSAYFIQALAANKEITYTHSGANHTLRAPKQAMESISEFALSLTNETQKETDRLYVGASEDALNVYEAGRELTKFAAPTEAKTAQVWANAYGLQLCDIDMPLNGEEANCTLGLYAPKAGQYTLSVKDEVEDASLYLTYNDQVIWDLTASPYVFDLAKGTTEGYGLRIAARAPQIATGVDETNANSKSVRKVLINNTIYLITPEGKMYDIVGKSVKY